MKVQQKWEVITLEVTFKANINRVTDKQPAIGILTLPPLRDFRGADKEVSESELSNI